MTTMAALEPLVGRWATTITMLHPAEMKDQVFRAIDTYRWLEGRQTLVHEVEARMGGQAVNSIEIYTAKDGHVVSRNFDGLGNVSDYRASMEGGVWQIEGANIRFTSTRVASHVIEGVWEQDAGEGWVRWMTVRLDRVM